MAHAKSRTKSERAGPKSQALSRTASAETSGTISSYLIERYQGADCSSFSQIGSSTNTTYTDTNLTPSTSYTYRVRAVDTANTTGPYSNTASATD
jgi:hypothetical protein